MTPNEYEGSAESAVASARKEPERQQKPKKFLYMWNVDTLSYERAPRMFMTREEAADWYTRVIMEWNPASTHELPVEEYRDTLTDFEPGSLARTGTDGGIASNEPFLFLTNDDLGPFAPLDAIEITSERRLTANRRNSQFASRSKRSGQFRGHGLRGWFGDRVRHAKAAMGIRTGRKKR